MARVEAHAERTIDAPADVVYGYLADMRTHHPRILPPAFTDFAVESGGVGAGTVVTYTVNAGGRHRPCRMAVTEPEPGRVLLESDTSSSLTTSFTVVPAGSAAVVTISTSWNGAQGVGGFFERLFAPRALQQIYADALDRLEAYATAQAAGGNS
jgi:hypothetical protein